MFFVLSCVHASIATFQSHTIKNFIWNSRVYAESAETFLQTQQKKTQHVIDRYMKRSIEYDYFQSLQR